MHCSSNQGGCTGVGQLAYSHSCSVCGSLPDSNLEPRTKEHSTALLGNGGSGVLEQCYASTAGRPPQNKTSITLMPGGTQLQCVMSTPRAATPVTSVCATQNVN